MAGDYLTEESSAIQRAEYELRRVDHLIYVSLKYTRTVDVIKNIIARLIDTFDIIWGAFLEHAEQEGIIFEIPTSPGAKIAQLKKLSTDPQVKQFLEFYMLLRQFNHAEYTAHQEFRRHVTMRAVFPNGNSQDLDIDIITQYYKDTKEFIEYAKEHFTYLKEDA